MSIHQLIFFGSFQGYSLIPLKALSTNPNFKVTAVVTTPPRPGDRGHIQQTPVHQYCLDCHLPVFPLEDISQIPPNLDPPDFIVVAGYGKLLNDTWLNFPKVMAINAHPSLLPDYAGRFPAEWAIIRGETITGITLIKMSPRFDTGDILVQKTISIDPTDTRDSLYQKLFTLIGQTLPDTLPKIDQITPIPQTSAGFYARQLTRDHGFITWNQFTSPQQQPLINRLFRALYPWPGVWTTTPNGKRLKIVALNPLTVQLEGKNPVPWNQIKKNYL